MRDIFLVAAIGVGLITTLRCPFAGILLWVWFTCMNPHEEVLGFARSLPMNLVIVIVTALAWLFSGEPKLPQRNVAVAGMILFFLWMTFNSFFAVDPDWSWPLWNRNWKILILGIFVVIMVTNRVRMQAVIWVVVISLMYYGIKGGVFTIGTGGSGHGI